MDKTERMRSARGVTVYLMCTCALLFSLACPSRSGTLRSCEMLGCDCYAGEVDCSDRGLLEFPEFSGSMNITKL